MTIKRRFITGEEWLYYKIYTGIKTSDFILSEVLPPLLKALQAEGVIQQWFFIRYADPDHHLRIRFRLYKSEDTGLLISKIQPLLKKLLEQELIWKIQTDTYERELERYGVANIQQVETLFFHESEMVCAFLNQQKGIEQENIQWLFCLRVIDDLLHNFEYTLSQKIELLKQLKEAFGKEFHINKNLRKQINKKFQEHRVPIQQILSTEKKQPQKYSSIFEFIHLKNKKTTPTIKEIITAQQAGRLQISSDQLLSSLVHMFINRLFKTNNRLYELILYEFLYRYYNGLLFKKRSTFQELNPKG